MTMSVQAELPDQLARQGQELIKNGWAPDMNTLLTEALRRYLESHPEALAEAFVREDVQWGLHGGD
ncbi:MAG: CopG family transcriptional regulator [Pseudomonadota bacterium]|nr:CopG family transcriptional regulator [Pseudomonadota bacterium]